MMPRQHRFPSLLLLAVALSNDVAMSQSHQPEQPQPSQLLGDVLHTMFDKNKDQRVTMKEVDSQLALLKMIFAGDTRTEAVEYQRLITGAQAAAPTFFDLLDVNGDAALTQEELIYTTHFAKAAEKDG